MSQTQHQPTARCNDCGHALDPLGVNDIGRPVYRCDNCETRQVGPFV